VLLNSDSVLLSLRHVFKSSEVRWSHQLVEQKEHKLSWGIDARKQATQVVYDDPQKENELRAGGDVSILLCLHQLHERR
jgi:hypothetical protein